MPRWGPHAVAAPATPPQRAQRTAVNLGTKLAGQSVARLSAAMTGPPPAMLLDGKVSQHTLAAVEGFTLQQLQALSLADLEGLGLRGEEARRLFLALRDSASLAPSASASPQLTPQTSGLRCAALNWEWWGRWGCSRGCPQPAAAAATAPCRPPPTDRAGRTTTWWTWAATTISSRRWRSGVLGVLGGWGPHAPGAGVPARCAQPSAPAAAGS